MLRACVLVGLIILIAMIIVIIMIIRPFKKNGLSSETFQSVCALTINWDVSLSGLIIIIIIIVIIIIIIIIIISIYKLSDVGISSNLNGLLSLTNGH